jgi:hypothetical protein
MVYPTLLAVIGDVAHPNWRASAVGGYRLWRRTDSRLRRFAAGVRADGFEMPGPIWPSPH